MCSCCLVEFVVSARVGCHCCSIFSADGILFPCGGRKSNTARLSQSFALIQVCKSCLRISYCSILHATRNTDLSVVVVVVVVVYLPTYLPLLRIWYGHLPRLVDQFIVLYQIRRGGMNATVLLELGFTKCSFVCMYTSCWCSRSLVPYMHGYGYLATLLTS